MHALQVAGIMVMVSLAGCLAGSDSGDDGTVAVAAPRFHAPVAVSDSLPGAEPVIAVAPDGTIYVEGVGNFRDTPQLNGASPVWRSRDGGQTWDDITPPTFDRDTNDGFVEVGTDGTVYAANVFYLSYHVYRSDDEGDSWVPLNVPRMPLLMHRHWIVAQGDTVHMTYEALPPSWFGFLVGQDPQPDPQDNPNQGMAYTRSDDRGTTWTTPVFIDPQANFAGQSNMVVSADGQTIAVARYEEDRDTGEYTYADGRFYIVVSEDGGTTWQRHEVTDLTSAMGSIITGLAIDPAGTLYVAWAQVVDGQSTFHMVHSTDNGRSWSDPVHPIQDGRLHAVPFIAARGDGAVAVLWYSSDARGAPGDVDGDWHVDYALITAADTDAPTAHMTRLTTEPQHHGNICVKGPGCDSSQGDDRRLLDYVWVDFGPDGTAHTVWSSTIWDNPSAFAVVAVEEEPFVPNQA